MDNEHEVSREIARVKDLFLSETFADQAKPPKIYDAEEEFKQTKKNRNFMVPITVVIFLVVFGAAATAVTIFIQRAANQVTIDIDEFQDVNMSEVLDVQKRNQTALQTATRELNDLQERRDEEIEDVRSEIEGKIEVARNEPISEQELNNRINELRAEEQRRIEEIRREYSPQIAEKQEEIQSLEDRIAQYDSRLIDQARETEQRLSNQEQLFELEQQRLEEYYQGKIDKLQNDLEKQRQELTQQKDEVVAALKRSHEAALNEQFLRFNPVFEEQEVLDALNRELDNLGINFAELPGYDATLASESIVSRADFQNLRNDLYDFDTITGRLQEIPYRNSIPTSLERLRALQASMVSGYESMWTSLADVVNRRNQTIAQQRQEIATRGALIDRFAYAVESFADTSRENGYVLDPRQRDGMLVYTNPNLPIQDGSTGFVFREVDDFIAEIELFQTDRGMRARLVTLADPDRPIRPFDIILIQLQ